MRTDILDYLDALKVLRDNKCPLCGGGLKIAGYCRDTWKCTQCNCFTTKVKEMAVHFSLAWDDLDNRNSGRTFRKMNTKFSGYFDTAKWPEIIQALLKMPKVLPALIGIDSSLDKLIAERLGTVKDG